MNGKVHVAIGVGTAACLLMKYPTGMDFYGLSVSPAIALLTATAGSYAPDIDLGRSHSGMKHKVASKVITKVGGGHRGITHALLVPTIVLILMMFVSSYLSAAPSLAYLLNSLLFGWEWGYLLHIFADLFNGKGVPLFWPLLQTKVHIMDLPSTGIVPWIFSVVLVGAFGALIFGGII